MTLVTRAPTNPERSGTPSLKRRYVETSNSLTSYLVLVEFTVVVVGEGSLLSFLRSWNSRKDSKTTSVNVGENVLVEPSPNRGPPTYKVFSSNHLTFTLRTPDLPTPSLGSYSETTRDSFRVIWTLVVSNVVCPEMFGPVYLVVYNWVFILQIMVYLFHSVSFWTTFQLFSKRKVLKRGFLTLKLKTVIPPTLNFKNEIKVPNRVPRFLLTSSW